MNYNTIIITESSSNLRALGREALRGKWKVAVIASLVYMIAVFVPVEILNSLFGGEYGFSSLASLYSLLITGPFTLGYAMFCISLFRNKNPETAQIFYGFEQFGKAFCLYFMVGLFTFLWTLLFIIPGLIAAIRYSQAFLILADNPNMPIMDCIAESKRLMNGNKTKFFCMSLSFIGWLILCMFPVIMFSGVIAMSIMMFGGMGAIMTSILSLVLSAGYLWVLPYMMVTYVGFYEMLTGNLRPGVIEGAAQIMQEPTRGMAAESTNTETYTSEPKPASEEPVSAPKPILEKEIAPEMQEDRPNS